MTEPFETHEEMVEAMDKSWKEFLAYLEDGNRLFAIKEVRSFSYRFLGQDCGLKAAKAFVEMQRSLSRKK